MLLPLRGMATPGHGRGRVRRRQVPRQRDAGNGGRGRSERSERSPLRDKLLPLRSSAHKKKRGCLKSRRTDSHLLFLYYVRMVLPSAELRSASPHSGPSHNLLRHRCAISRILRAPSPFPCPGMGTSASWQHHDFNCIQKYSYHIEI